MSIGREYKQVFERLWPEPARCIWKSEPSDFIVGEIWEPLESAEEGNDGEHTLLLVSKAGQNTQWVARQIARFAGVRDMDVGYHGLKDRHGITTQWFSIYAGKREVPDYSKLTVPGVEILQTGRTRRKLRRGGHQGNHFEITLKSVRGDKQTILSKIDSIRSTGFPNYFGMQRFGIGGNNLRIADEWLSRGIQPKKKSVRGMVLSAARSYLFNEILEKRVLAGTWSGLIPGDKTLPDSNPDNRSPIPTGPLLGGAEFLADIAGELEKNATKDFGDWLCGLHREGLRTSRRPLVARANNFTVGIAEDIIRLQFDLAPGCFASVLLAQIFELSEPACREQRSPLGLRDVI